MKWRKIFLPTCFLLCLSIQCLAQDASQWRNYTDSGKEIWFQAPASVLVDRDSDLKAVTLHSFFDGVKVSVRKQKIGEEPLKYVKDLDLPFGLKGSKVQNYKSDAIYVRREDEMVSSDLRVTLYAGSKKSYFVVTLTAAKDNAAMKRFLETIRFGGSRLYADPNVQDKPTSGEPAVFDTLPASPETETALIKKPTGPEPAGKFGNVREWLPLELDKLSGDVIVLRKPAPTYTDSARMRGVQGTIFVNVQFLANGEIGSITVDDRADRGLGKNVIKAVRDIKFIPAQANGKPIDATRTLFYRFSIY
jgi:TonB family protein